jgi:lipopolysaccharide/colanic/teichoic acid biosynthesis glycosyltransferase
MAAVIALAALWHAAVPQVLLDLTTSHGTYFWLAGLLAAGHGCLTVLAQRLVQRLPPRPGRRWSYRLAFLFSLAAGWLMWLRTGTALSAGEAFWLPSSILLGAFLGGFLATTCNHGLWEDSFPPSLQVEAEVRACHLALLSRALVEPRTKRPFDFVLALCGLMLTAPLWLVLVLVIWFEDPGPVFFVKNSVGRGGNNFRQLKFRSMICDAETKTGPIPARRADRRLLWTGRLLRKSALDELPQLVNVLRGEMSCVGPRPLRTLVVHACLRELPEFAERHLVRPGIAGLAQVMAGYYVTPLQRLRFDRLYMKRMGPGLDLKILIIALMSVLSLHHGEGWNRHMLRCRPR